MSIKRILKEQHWASTTVLLFGLISVFVLLFIQHIYRQQRAEAVVANLLMDIQIMVPNIHLQLEKGISGDTSFDINATLDRFDHCINLVETILSGGEVETGPVLQGLGDPGKRSQLMQIMSLLVNLKGIAWQRHLLSRQKAKNAALDEKFDSEFMAFLEAAKVLETEVKREQRQHNAEAEHLYVTVTLFWICIVTLSSLSLSRLERKRKANEIALKDNNQRLKSLTEELEVHEKKLAELVEKRTAELSDSNRDLRENILKRNQAIEAMEESRNKFESLSLEFHALLDAIPDYLILFTPDMHVRWANAKVVEEFDEKDLALADHYCCLFWNRDSTRCDVCPVSSTFQTGKADAAQISRQDGRVWDIRTFPIMDEGGRVRNVIEIAREVTDKISLQAGALRAAHLASLGELAAGIAHEINNPLNGIINFAQILVDDTTMSDENTAVARRIIQEGERTANIVASLLSFAREAKTEKAPARPYSLLGETLALLGRQLEKDAIILKVHVSHELPELVINSQQIMQVYLNIISNARYALNLKYPGRSGGKILEILGEQTAIDSRFYVHMVFHDCGVGIPPEEINKVMNPFFSTKPRGRGTGLGLSISHGIVTEHEGRFFIESKMGEFTKVHVFLPVAR